MLKVLLVDDDEMVCTVHAEILRSVPDKDIECKTASNGKEALEILRSEKFDVLVTDSQMPVMGGEQLIAAVLSGEVGENVSGHIVFCTGLPNADPFVGVTVLRKPASVGAFLEAVLGGQ